VKKWRFGTNISYYLENDAMGHEKTNRISCDPPPCYCERRLNNSKTVHRRAI